MVTTRQATATHRPSIHQTNRAEVTCSSHAHMMAAPLVTPHQGGATRLLQDWVSVRHRSVTMGSIQLTTP